MTVLFFQKHHSVLENSTLTKKEQERPVSNDQPSCKSVSKSEMPDLMKKSSENITEETFSEVNIPPSDTTTFQQKGKPVEIQVAQLVAVDYIPKYRPGDWVYFDKFTYYDLDGNPAVYELVYKKPEAQINNRESLIHAINSMREERDLLIRQIKEIEKDTNILTVDVKNQLKELRQQKSTLQRKMYMTDEFQTVMTGATTVSDPLIRCRRGLPYPFVKKEELKKMLEDELSDKNLNLQEVIYLGPTDLFYKAGDFLVSVRDGSLKKIEEVKKRLEADEAIRNAYRSKLSEEQRQKLEDAEEKQKQYFQSKWNNYTDQVTDRGENIKGE